MRSILHMADLHFGRIDPAAVAALGALATELSPDLVAVSGGVTQRGLKLEFMAARRFLEAIPAPKIVVPGNHDLPAYAFMTRLFAPHAPFTRYLGQPVESAFQDEQMTVVGANTTRVLTFKGGRINREQLAAIGRTFCQSGNANLRVLVTHHPFDLPLPVNRRDIVGRADVAMAAFRNCMPDLFLSGHMHVHGAFTTASGPGPTGRSAVVVQAGTATSTRTRGERNSFNLVYLEQDRIAVHRFDWLRDRNRFDLGGRFEFARKDAGWYRAQ